MEDPIVRLESRVACLTNQVAGLERRVAIAGARRAGVSRRTARSRHCCPIVSFGRAPVQQWLGIAGRTLVVLGGAYLLRALTGSHVLSAQAGVGLGILYGAPWLLLASRAAAHDSQVDAFAHALTASLIGYPLVWEATLRFNVISPEQSAALLGGLTAAALVLSSMRKLQGLAWVITIGALLSAAGLAIATESWVAYTVLAIGIGLATLWLGYTQDWTMLRWPAAATANLMLLIVTGRAAGAGAVPAALAVQLLMLVGYLGSFAVRTLFIGREVIPFEVAQSVAVLAVGLGGAISLVRATGSNVVLIGLASLVLAAAGYIVAFTFVERHRHVKNFFFYTLLAQLFAIVGIGLCAGADTGSLIYSAVAIACAAMARRSRRLTLALQATVYALVAALGSGLVDGRPTSAAGTRIWCVGDAHCGECAGARGAGDRHVPTGTASGGVVGDLCERPACRAADGFRVDGDWCRDRLGGDGVAEHRTDRWFPAGDPAHGCSRDRDACRRARGATRARARGRMARLPASGRDRAEAIARGLSAGTARHAVCRARSVWGRADRGTAHVTNIVGDAGSCRSAFLVLTIGPRQRTQCANSTSTFMTGPPPSASSIPF